MTDRLYCVVVFGEKPTTSPAHRRSPFPQTTNIRKQKPRWMDHIDPCCETAPVKQRVQDEAMYKYPLVIFVDDVFLSNCRYSHPKGRLLPHRSTNIRLRSGITQLTRELATRTICCSDAACGVLYYGHAQWIFFQFVRCFSLIVLILMN